MAKKAKRKVSQVTVPGATPEVMEERSYETASTSPARSAVRRAPVTQEFNPDYSYVVKDLKRIGVLAGTFFAVLVILSFFIR